jgi:mono/diheme cytochrome c family protein
MDLKSLLRLQLCAPVALVLAAGCASAGPAEGDAAAVPAGDAGEADTSTGVIALGEDEIITDTEPLYATLFTTDQAAEGEQLFRAVCSDCHEATEFSSSTFLYDWEGATVGQLYRYIAENMPDDNAGGLEETQYEAVMAYILSRNGYPSG